MKSDKPPIPTNPSLFQLHALSFLRRLEAKHKKKLTLLSLPAEEWKALARRGFNCLWLMGVWERSPLSQRSALAIPELRQAFDRVLPGWRQNDVPGSPYAVKSYSLDGRLGKKNDLARLKKKLNAAGLGLILDFVPNHLATDHTWIDIPERFVRASAADLKKNPQLFFKGGKKGLPTAHGKDPCFPGWQDTAQINIFSANTRKALIGELVKVAAVCDGVRCDMAMLLLNGIFKKTWDGYLSGYPEPDREFWPEAFGRVKKKYPYFIFIAEVYWDLERRLQDLGFDFTYDKKLYDLLRWSTAREIKERLLADVPFLEHSVHFTENHDEERALTAFGRKKSYAAAAAVATLPGMRFFHDGQAEGKRLHFPIQLERAVPEPSDPATENFYKKLFSFAGSIDFAGALWSRPEVFSAADGDSSHENLLCWQWDKGGKRHLVVINYSSSVSGGAVSLKVDAGGSGLKIFRNLKPWEVVLQEVPRP